MANSLGDDAEVEFASDVELWIPIYLCDSIASQTNVTFAGGGAGGISAPTATGLEDDCNDGLNGADGTLSNSHVASISGCGAGGSSTPLPLSTCDAAPCVNTCAADTNINNIVNVTDVWALIGAWGTCANPNNCPADVEPPGIDDLVNVTDLLAIIGARGACP